jgi:ATP-dependent protease ClpP protease subunit
MSRLVNRAPLTRVAPQGGKTGAWFKIENKAATVAEVYIYDEIGMWGMTAGDFVNEVRGITASAIELHINSPGGEVFDGIAIYNALKSHRATVAVHVDGLAASIASVIAMAGDTVSMARNATMMIHDGLMVCVGNAADMARAVELLNKTSDNIADIYAAKAGGDVKAWRKLMQAETWYSADEAVAAGLADEVTGAAPDDKVSAAWDLSVFAYAGRDKAPAPLPVMSVTPLPVEDEGTAARFNIVDSVEVVVPLLVVEGDATDYVGLDFASLLGAFKISEPEPDFDPALFRAGMEVALNNVPEGASDTEDVDLRPPVEDDGPIRFDAEAFKRGLRGARAT